MTNRLSLSGSLIAEQFEQRRQLIENLLASSRRHSIPDSFLAFDMISKIRECTLMRLEIRERSIIEGPDQKHFRGEY
jgi:hypothetical protein